MKRTINTFISPCPNDTFVFGPLIYGEISSDDDYMPQLMDIEELNEVALSGTADVIKVSAALYPKLKDQYYLLPSGAAMGKSSGPLLVTKNNMKDFSTVGLPGEHTTAHFLFDYLYPDFEGEKVDMIFSEIEQAIVSGDIDAGVIIHESRFTYRDRGLQLVDDLGEVWNTNVDKPLPLGIILTNRDLGSEFRDDFDLLLKKSINLSWEKFPDLDKFVTENAQEMDEDTMRQHIELYVNEFTMDLGDEGHEAIYFMEKVERNN